MCTMDDEHEDIHVRMFHECMSSCPDLRTFKEQRLSLTGFCILNLIFLDNITFLLLIFRLFLKYKMDRTKGNQ
jgi:hypothetical protein